MAFSLFRNKTDAQLDKLEGFFGSLRRGHSKVMNNGIGFFGLLGLGIGACLLLPAVPHLMLFILGGGALASMGTLAVASLGSYVKDEKERRNPAPVQEAAETNPGQPLVSALPDLSEAFRVGITNAVTVKTLRYKNTRSAFLS